MLFSTLWVYRTAVKTSIGFTPFQLVYGLEAMLPIECEIPSLQMAIELLPATFEEEKCLLYLAQLDENRCDAALAIETHVKLIKAQYDRNVTPRNFSEGDLVLLYDQANDKLGAGKFIPMCWVPIILVITPLLLYLYPLFILLCPYYPHIVISVPHRISLLLFLWLYIIIVRSAGLYCDSLDSYI